MATKPKPDKEAGKGASIYALCQPGTMALRYVGKANDPAARLAGHIRDSIKERRNTPACNWIRKLGAKGLRPVMVILKDNCSNWEADERDYIRRARLHGHKVLNLADGGNQPYQTKEQRRAAGVRLNKMMRGEIPMKFRMETREELVIYTYGSILDLAVRQFRPEQAEKVRVKMRQRYAEDPKAYSCWAAI